MLPRYFLSKFKIPPISYFIQCRFLCYKGDKMNNTYKKLYLKREGQTDQFEATFNWSYLALNINRDFNFNRRITETLEQFIVRIKTNVEKIVLHKIKRKKKKKQEVETFEGNICVSFVSEGKDVPLSLSCEDVFFSDIYDANKLVLKVMDTKYHVIVNSPSIKRLAIPPIIMTGFPIYPSVDIQFGNKVESQFTWYSYCDLTKEWTEVGKNLVYTPLTNEIGKKLKLHCIPGRGCVHGLEITSEAISRIEEGPGSCPYHTRHSFTKESTPPDSFRVVSYNILADMYTETELAKTELFPYCPSKALTLDYRKQLYLQEITGYNADIICLQEVDVKIFSNELQDVLGGRKFKGFLTKKGGTVSEGVAIFYSTEKFRLVRETYSVLGEEIDVNPIYKNIWAKIKTNKALSERFKERNTVLQVLILESLFNPKEKIVIGNTHLFFQPDADHIRLLQAGMVLAFLEDLSKNLRSMGPSANISLLMCGDFNSTPDSGIYQLMTKKHVPSNIIDWTSKADEEVVGLELKHSFEMESAYGTPMFTNYTTTFSGCLDYIYYQKDKLNLVKVVPLPEEEELKKNVAIPSFKFPSDHVALVVDFEWKLP